MLELHIRTFNTFVVVETVAVHDNMFEHTVLDKQYLDRKPKPTTEELIEAEQDLDELL